MPLIWEFTGTNAQKIFAQKAKTHFLYFITVEDAQKQVEPLKPVAIEYKDKITFVYINVQEKSNEQVMKFFGIDNKMVPMYTLFEVNMLVIMVQNLKDSLSINSFFINPQR